MNRTQFNQHIQTADFRNLFIEIGWNNNRGNIDFTIDDIDFLFNFIVERNGFQVLTCNVNNIPSTTLCRKIDSKLRRFANDYICIFIAKEMHHQWVVPIRTSEKRDITTVEYINLQQTDFLFSKLNDFSFRLDEITTIVDVKQRVQSAFTVNSEKITKDFFAGFNKQHKIFSEFISGIDDQIAVKDNKNKQWYTCVMLNRLMFCYFIQKKGFLNFDTNYLQNKLQECQRKRGENKFFSTFYKGFLCHLFQKGLNSPQHNEDFEVAYGRIPYLNGGMFDQHQIEKQYADLDIDDHAFESLFSFFDKWNWHLDTRITASGKDINPDVLGYIFEQYINDRSAMGAYYTKEDITGYIGKNCIIPFLMDKTAEKSTNDFKANGFVWDLLKNSGDQYVYPAVKRGYTPDWQQRIPDYIAQGIDTTKGNLLERRARWNEKTDENFALPTEIWRETIERLQRCEQLLDKIRQGEIVKINDFITYNLDITTFAEDVIRKTDDHLLVRHFYEALQNVTILDPTCGSGAFLFAALNILEPLYEACLDRMEDFHQKNDKLFKDELEEISNRYRSNRQYFIYKSIILRNLYGVDIMVEATEIAKLRLFLKMVAVVEVDRRADNLGLDPLPDIDFNIKCGNTLVGYATEKELNHDLSYGDMYVNAEFREKIETQMSIVAKAYELFRNEQLKVYDDNTSIKQTKEELNARLAELNDLLNHRLHQSTTTDNYEAWLASHQPFHWLTEFYQIIHDNGGFDVIIGNPPYVVYTKNKFKYKIEKFKTLPSENLYSFVFERSFLICNNNIGLIVQMSAIATEGMTSLQNYLVSHSDLIHYSIYPERPKQLFDGACIALSILMCHKTSLNNDTKLFGSGISRFSECQRLLLFQNLRYISISQDDFLKNTSTFPKFKNNIEKSIIKKFKHDKSFSQYFINSGNNFFAYRSAGGRYWKPILSREYQSESSSNKIQNVMIDKNIVMALCNSNLFWWHYVNASDLFNMPLSIFSKFYYSDKNDYCSTELNKLGIKLMNAYEQTKIYSKQYIQSRQKETIFEKFNPQLSKPIIDEIDKVLAKHYGFTEEELDFIINYDIKYRMGDELNSEGDE